MMADLVAAFRLAVAAQGLAVDVRDGVENPAQELQTPDPVTGLPLPRVVFIENGLAGNLRDKYGPNGNTRPGIAAPAHLYATFMTRIQTCEMRVWGFDASVDASGQTIATPLSHRAAVNRLLHDPTAPTGPATGLFPALYAVLGMAKETWEPVTGAFDNTAKDIQFGALYVFEFNLAIPVIGRRVAIATPAPAVKPQGP